MNLIGSIESVINFPVSKRPYLTKILKWKGTVSQGKIHILLPNKLKNKITGQVKTQVSTTVTKLIPSLSHIFSPEAWELVTCADHILSNDERINLD